jgi:hypothetical protein
MKTSTRIVLSLAMILAIVIPAFAAITGVISGTITDSSGAVMPGVSVVVLNEQTGIRQTRVSDSKGFYSFPALDVGTYTISTTQTGFESYQQTGIKVDANSSIRGDITLKVGSVNQVEEIQSNSVQVETQSSQLGEVIEADKITAVPLNGRAFTDLLALQPGVSPYVGKAEGGAGAVSGSLNAGNMSINGGREASNGFMVNGGDVNDGVENGTAIVPNLDSISEFRIITDNYDAEYGNFSGGQVNVVTKSGTNHWHGSGFEFLRNTVFNARGYSFVTPAPARGPYTQNIYGGTFGGPVKKDKMFFFADYQGTKRSIGTTDSAQAETAADMAGNVADMMSVLPMNNQVVGTGWAGVLSKRLGYPVTAGENYWTSACASTTQCVFPGAVIPTKVWSSAVPALMKYLQAPNSVGSNGLPAFTTSASSTTLTDNKEAGRIDLNTRYGTLFGYYFLDNDAVGNPYAGGTAGGFPAATQGRAQMSNVGLTTTLKNNAVNTFRFTYMRSATHTNNPTYSTPGPSLTSLGFVTPWSSATGGTGNIYGPLAGVPQISVDGMSFGTPTETQAHIDNTFQWLDNYMKVIGTHTLQFGGNYHYDQIMERNYYDVNGGYSFSDANETGNGFADFLLGAEAGGFTQASPQILDSRSNYIASYVEDSWRARSNLTLNFGVRYEITTPWYDTQNKLETIIPGEQSKVFPGAPLGWVFPGDAGVSRTLAPIKYNKFAPRFGFAYAPKSSGGMFGKLFGNSGDFSIRGGAGLFYTNYQDESGFVEVGDAPYGLYYQAPVPTMLESPYIDRGTQNIELAKFPFAFPPTNVSPSNPDNNIPWASLEPLSSSDAIGPHNTVPYIESYFLGLQRGIGRATVFTMNYVGSQGRHLANSEEANPGNAALCLSLSQKTQVAPGSSVCGPKLESQVYTAANGTVYQGTRPLDGLAFGANPYLLTTATSNFNSLQTQIKHSSKYWDVLVGYTFGRSMDNASALTDATNPFNPRLSYGLSEFDVTHYLVASYNVHLPLEKLTGNGFVKQIIGGWAISGITKMATGVPIGLSDSEDYSLTGASGVDFPYYTPGNLHAGGINGDHNPRDINPATGKHYPYFNTALFTAEGKEFSPKTLGYGMAGNSRRRFFHGPGLDHTDLAVLRDFHIHESHVIQLRLEAFNFMNHAEFSNPSGSATSSTFGIISGSSNARILQVAAKYKF